MVPTYDLRNLRPRELNAVNNLVSNDGMVGHLTEFFRIKCARFAEQFLIHRNLTNVM